ncbi:ester cyclase [Azospirillum sp. YIM B02556]|uniref:Ester cyclase n=1 Tax=Azospirillum endophyticum TaxID=2800326 RepID=A0ABS1FHD1_9PROT|nr:ester cyclase [Azospirillum endophyticum]MBK1842839.1 ester cyclase [Azospirillum endophyticum]
MTGPITGPISTRTKRRVAGGALSLIAALAAASLPLGQAAAETLPQPAHLAGDAASPTVLAARRYAAFWNSGEEAFARAALAPGFTDRTLPPGRPQGVDGPLQASRAFRAAVPDLTAAIEDMVATGDRVAVHLRFRGHFTGRFGEVRGSGQTVDFQAFDLYRVADGRIAENWHLEDNLTLLQQLGIVKQ